MYKQALFFSLLIMQVHLPALCMQEQKLLTLQPAEYVLNETFSLTGKAISSIHMRGWEWRTEEGRSVRKKYSNPCNNKYLTLYEKYNSDYQNSGLNAFSQCLSILNTSTNIDRPYDLVPEFENGNRITALHLLDSSTPVVAHNNQIHILKEQFSLKNFLQNIIYMRSSYALAIKKTLTPHVDAHATTDTIRTIDSSNNYLVTISDQGHISSWQKNESNITNNSPQTIQCKKKFFSSGVYPADNIMCLGLENGNIFIIPLNDLKKCRETTIFPNSKMNVSWITQSADKLLFACLDESDSSYMSITANQIDQPAPSNTIRTQENCRELYIVNDDIVVAATKGNKRNGTIATFNRKSGEMLESEEFYVSKLLQPKHNNFLVMFDTGNDLTKCSSYYPETKTIKEKTQRIMHWTINEQLKMLIYCGIPLTIFYYIAYVKIAPKMLLPIIEPIYFCLKAAQ